MSHNRRPIKRARLSDVDELLKEGRRIKVPRLVGDELEVYVNSELETDDNLVPLQYWLRDAVRAKYPSLSKFAIDVYSAPAMSSEAERAFSTAGFTLKGRRYCLKEDTTEALLCLNHWGSTNLINVAYHENDELRGSQVAAFDNNDELVLDEAISDDLWYDGSSS